MENYSKLLEMDRPLLVKVTMFTVRSNLRHYFAGNKGNRIIPGLDIFEANLFGNKAQAAYCNTFGFKFDDRVGPAPHYDAINRHGAKIDVKGCQAHHNNLLANLNDEPKDCHWFALVRLGPNGWELLGHASHDQLFRKENLTDRYSPNPGELRYALHFSKLVQIHPHDLKPPSPL